MKSNNDRSKTINHKNNQKLSSARAEDLLLLIIQCRHISILVSGDLQDDNDLNKLLALFNF